MGIYKKLLEDERAFLDRETKNIIRKYRHLTYQGKLIHEIVGYKNFSGFVGEGSERTPILNKILIKQLGCVLTLIKRKENIPSLYPVCFRYERKLIEQDHNGSRSIEIRQHPVDHGYLKKLQEAMEEYNPKLKLYESENGISIAYKDHPEPTQTLLNEDKDLFGLVKHAYLLTTENEINKILDGVERLKDYSKRVYDRYLSIRR